MEALPIEGVINRVKLSYKYLIFLAAKTKHQVKYTPLNFYIAGMQGYTYFFLFLL